MLLLALLAAGHSASTTTPLATPVLAPPALPTAALVAPDLQQAAAAAPVQASEWTFDFAPYYWAASVGGSVTVDGEDIDLEGGGDGFFGEPALSGFLGHFEAHHGPWSYVLAPTFITSELEGGQSPNVDADVTIRAQMHEAFVAREFAPHWEWLLGARYQQIDTEIDLSIANVLQGSVDDTRSWLDPIVGLRYQTGLGEDWGLHARADIGGFGAGSDFAWNASLLASYSISEHWGAYFGYRALVIQFEDRGGSDDLEYDLSLYGPIIGVNYSL
jgi:hypothetical protein